MSVSRAIPRDPVKIDSGNDNYLLLLLFIWRG